MVKLIASNLNKVLITLKPGHDTFQQRHQTFQYYFLKKVSASNH